MADERGGETLTDGDGGKPDGDEGSDGDGGKSDGDGGSDGDEGSDGGRPEPTPQSAALRRQQLFVGSGVAVLGGVAVVAAAAQRYPGYPFVVYLLAGMAASALLFGLTVGGVSGTE
jgi:hypothetical protein